MEHPPALHEHVPHEDRSGVNQPKFTFWQKMGGGSLTISLLVHTIILIAGIFWIFRVIHDPKPEVDFMPGGAKGGGGGERDASHDVKKKKQAALMPSTSPKRVFAANAASTFSLPPQDESFGEMSQLSALSTGGMSGGLGGSGNGGGLGNGSGKGIGSGVGSGFGGGGAKATLFGLADPNANALIGEFYDLKQLKDQKPSDKTDAASRQAVINDFAQRWSEHEFNKFYRAPQKLAQSQIYIPLMRAEAAPAAFQCEKEVQPAGWVVVYRGNVIAPKTGKFRFVGAADDILMVRFNKRTVFDFGYYYGSAPLKAGEIRSAVASQDANSPLVKNLKKGPIKQGQEYYHYPNSSHYEGIGGYMTGEEFNVRQGESYPIEILLSEIPGGYFGAALMIEEIGAKYEKTSTGSPLLPLFRTGSEVPEVKADNAPPFDPNGPVWKVDSKSKRSISF